MCRCFWRKFIPVILSFCFSLIQICYPEERTFSEGQIKATYVYNIAKFTVWPKNKDIDFCLIGKGPVDKDLWLLDGKDVHGRILRLKRITNPQEAKECDMLFIHPSERERTKEIVETVKGHLVLTLGDTEGFGEKGVMINFFRDGNKVRMEINLNAIEESRLRISSRLLRLGVLVGTRK